jgi:hypothetical protein
MQFSNVIDAGMMAATYAFWQSANDPQHNEWAGEIYKNPDGTYSFDTGRGGGAYTVGSCPECIPDGTDFVAGYHTHGILSGPDDLNADFSPGDSELIAYYAGRREYPKFIGGFLSSSSGQVVYMGPKAAEGYIAPLLSPPSTVICSSCVGPLP